jgi:hypothetical protein
LQLVNFFFFTKTTSFGFLKKSELTRMTWWPVQNSEPGPWAASTT